MACFIGCLALFVPRFAIVVVALFSDYIGDAYSSILWPLLGFFLLPTTTLTYAWAQHATAGNVEGLHFAAVVVAVLVDLGIIGGNAKQASSS